MTYRDPAHIMEIATGFWRAKTLLSAVELDLFTLLGEGAMTGQEIQASLDLHARAIPDFLDALVALKVLERGGNRIKEYNKRLHRTAFPLRSKPAGELGRYAAQGFSIPTTETR